mgnify:CR=1 FL=1
MKTFKEFIDICEAGGSKSKQPKIKGGNTRSGLMGMSSSLSTTGSPSGAKFMPGQGGRYGIAGTGLAD